MPVSPSALDVTFGDTSLSPSNLDVTTSPASRLVLECSWCSADDRFAPSPTSNAPWSAGISTSFGVGGARLDLSLLGSRNYRLPRYMAQPLGTTTDVTPAGASSYADLTSPRTEWTISARLRRTLKTFGGGQTIGVIGDAWLHLNTGRDPARSRDSRSPSPGTDVPLLPAASFRFGVGVGF